MRRLLLTVWIGGWAFGVAFGAFWLMHEGWELMKHQWIWVGLGLIVASLAVLALGGKLFWITGMVMTGRLNGRLADRALRNALSDAVMFGKTGMTKW